MLRTYLCAFGGCGTHCSAEDLLDDIWQQADRNKQDDAQPGWTTGQHLHENVVHPLVVQEGPEQKKEREMTCQFFRNVLGFRWHEKNKIKLDYTK